MIYRLHILPAAPLFDGKRTIDLSSPDTQEAVYYSLASWVDAAKPPVLREHDRNLGECGRVLGIERDEQGIYAIADVDVPPNARHASAHIVWNHKANDGSRWKAALLEVSLTTVPQFVLGQQEIAECGEEFFSRMSVEIGEGIADQSTHAEDPSALTEVQMDEILELLRAITARLDALETPAEAPAQEAESAAESVLAEEAEETAEEVVIEAESVTEEAVEEVAEMIDDLARAHARIAELEAELEGLREKGEDQDAALESVMSSNPILSKYRKVIAKTGNAQSIAQSVTSIMSSRQVASRPHTPKPRKMSAEDMLIAEIEASLKANK